MMILLLLKAKQESLLLEQENFKMLSLLDIHGDFLTKETIL